MGPGPEVLGCPGTVHLPVFRGHPCIYMSPVVVELWWARPRLAPTEGPRLQSTHTLYTPRATEGDQCWDSGAQDKSRGMQKGQCVGCLTSVFTIKLKKALLGLSSAKDNQRVRHPDDQIVIFNVEEGTCIESRFFPDQRILS